MEKNRISVDAAAEMVADTVVVSAEGGVGHLQGYAATAALVIKIPARSYEVTVSVMIVQ